MSGKKVAVMLSVLFLPLALLVTGCAGPAGTLRRDAGSTSLFERGEILPDHTYYWSGVMAEPDGLLAVEKGFTLKTTLWNEFDPGGGTMKEMVGRMRERGSYTSRFPFGSILYAEDGRRVGAWYSEADWTNVLMRGENTVEITTPGNLIRHRDRGRGTIWGR